MAEKKHGELVGGTATGSRAPVYRNTAPATRRRGSYSGSRTGNSFSPWSAAQSITSRGKSSSSKMLAAELLVGGVIVGIRVLGDYQVTEEGTVKGTLNTPANGGYGPFTVLTGLIGSFFILSFLAVSGGTKAKVAVVIGALIDIVLLLKSMDEVEIVAKYITASPATKTVLAADYTLSSQPWGAASAVSSASTVNLAADYSGSNPGYFTGPVSGIGLPLSGATSSPGSSSTGPAVTSSSTSTITIPPLSSAPTTQGANPPTNIV